MPGDLARLFLAYNPLPEAQGLADGLVRQTGALAEGHSAAVGGIAWFAGKLLMIGNRAGVFLVLAANLA